MFKLIKFNTLIIIFALVACSDNTTSNPPTTAKSVSIFDGKTFKGWHNFNGTDSVKSWAIEDSALVCLGTAADAHGGDIVTNDEYDNFELSWEWKISKGGNSGVMYHVVEDHKYKAPYETGPEYQLIDDIGFPAKLEEWQKTGADYAMHLPNDKKQVKPVGEWNSSKIIVQNNTVEHWLNGEKIVAFRTDDATWQKVKKGSKWNDFPDYGTAKKGRIALQDHGNKAYFRRLSIKNL
jgi:hypothetical protein